MTKVRASYLLNPATTEKPLTTAPTYRQLTMTHTDQKQKQDPWHRCRFARSICCARLQSNGAHSTGKPGAFRPFTLTSLDILVAVLSLNGRLDGTQLLPSAEDTKIHDCVKRDIGTWRICKVGEVSVELLTATLSMRHRLVQSHY